jgi:AraC-like DNA-binding protein
MLAGKCWVEPVGFDAEPQFAEPGDVILFPRGDSHVMGSEPGRNPKPNMNLYFRPVDQRLPFLLTEIGGRGDAARFVCGYLGCDAGPFNPLLDALPRLTVIKADPVSGNLMADLIKAALAEGSNLREGGETMLAKLSELLLVQALRRHIDSLPASSRSWLSGLRDPAISRALNLIHGQPSRDWTLALLARETGMSRSNLAQRFQRFVGETPMHYLARWRMQLAIRALERPDAVIADIAEGCGYQSEAAFNRAFKKLVGVPPGEWRRMHLAPRPAFLAAAARG